MQRQKSVMTKRGHEKNLKLSIQWNRWLLIPIGVWPNLRRSIAGKYFSWLINIICFGLIGFMLVSCGLFLLMEVKQAYNQIKMIGPLSFFTMTFMKYYLLILHESDIREGVKRIEWDWKNIEHQDDKNIMTEHASYGRRLVTICTFFMYSAFAFYYLVVPLSMGRVVIEDANLSFIALPFPASSLIADTRRSPSNEIVYTIQVLTGVVMHAITSGACSIAAVFAVHACGQMQVLMNWLSHLVDGRSDMSNTVEGRMATIVTQHDRVLKFMALTERAIQQISFVEFLGCMANMCLLGYYAIVEWNPKDLMLTITYLSLIISLTFNIFIFCYIGELVAEQCRKVGEMTYMIDWYRLSGKKKLGCILIIAMSNSSMKFTAGNMIELSINTFSDVVKTAVAFLNMLRQRSVMSKLVEISHERNVNLSIQWNRWLLIPIGAWPSTRETITRKYIPRLINIICFALIIFMFVSCSLFLIVEVEQVYNQIRMIGPLSFFMMTFMKYYLLILHKDDIREGIERIEWDWKNIEHHEDKNIMLQHATYGRKIVAVCTFFVYSAFAFYYIAVPVSVGKVVAEGGNFSYTPLPFPASRLIADVYHSPSNEIIHSIQVLTGMVMHSVTSAACSIAAVFAVHACGQMQVLINWLGYLVDGRPDMSNTVEGRMATIVSQHDRILKFIALTEKAMQQISFVEFLGCMMNMCLLGYYAIMEWNSKDAMFVITYMSLMMSFTFNIFIFCYIGELVAEQCSKVGEMTYMIDWYRLTGKKKLGCILIIAMSNSSTKFTAGNMVELSINTFSDVVKTAVAFLNMLRAMT
ncbi:uncharacterized protein LOC122532478 [Frieseomelitta varia]|uniref:uncharacterized protein LOC122532478 n=1 Tax=Frieseomelitta varia TaxID=561572 RepID=UPI001CB6907A|nr:uncharacterized protein LOC122532478 [Frieseomelitta varia]